MKVTLRKNLKLSVAIAMLLCLALFSTVAIKSNASVIRQDEWMKKFLEYRSINSELSDEELAQLVDSEMNALEQTQNLNKVQNTSNIIESSNVDDVTNQKMDVSNNVVDNSNQVNNVANNNVVDNSNQVNNVTDNNVVDNSNQNNNITDVNTNDQAVSKEIQIDENKDAEVEIINKVSNDNSNQNSNINENADTQNEKENISPCDCEECKVFYSIYQ